MLVTEEREIYNAHAGMTDLEASFLQHWCMLTLDAPVPVSEYRFCERRWRLDFAWPEQKVAVECEGGTWISGRHVRGKGFENDCHKYNRATLNGWRVFRCTSSMLRDDPAAFVAMVEVAVRSC